MNSVFINGTGCTKFGRHDGLSAVDLGVFAGAEALSESGISPADIDVLYVGNMLGIALDEQGHLGAIIAEKLGISAACIRTEAACASGGIAVHLGWKDVFAGFATNALVIGTEKMTDHSSATVNQALMGATTEAESSTGITFGGLYALIAQAYMKKHGHDATVFSPGMQLMHRQATENTLAQFHKNFSNKQIESSQMVSSPMRLLHAAPITDGAAALVLSAKKSSTQITASATKSGPPGLSNRADLTQILTTSMVLANALNQAEISISDIDQYCLHDCFSISLSLAVEDLGLAKRGQAHSLLETMLQRESEIIINPWGGLKAFGHPVGATGVRQLITLARNQTDRVKTGLAHNVGGTGGTVVIHIVKKA